MADGWETRRRRGPGNEWAIVRLASAGTIEQLELDTSHFKGNYPARCLVEGVRAPGVPVDQLEGWRPLVASPMQPHRRHVWDGELRRIGPVTHLRVSTFPCGGIARLRAWGELATEPSAGLAALNALGAGEATAALRKCCGSTKWAEAMASARPFEDVAALLRIGERTWWSLGEADHREAFAAHPKIGAKKADDEAASWSKDEQRGASSGNAEELAAANRAYEEKHGFIFIVCATGRSADSMLSDLKLRLGRAPADELRTAAEEQAKITRLRLHKLIGELA
jgi:allantoicase